MILSLISPTVKDTSNVRNVIQYFVPDVASTASLLSLLVMRGYLNQKHYVICKWLEENNYRRSGLWI